MIQSSSDQPVPHRAFSFGPDVWKIAFSAFFADLGYQVVIAGLPLFLVFVLRGPWWVYGLATALAYGPGAFIAYVGGRLGDRVGRKRIAVLGNALIPLLSLTGIVASLVPAIGLFVTGWWARNFRSPARRAMLTEVVEPEQESQAFGLLHALDIGGGMLAAACVLLLIFFGVGFRIIFLLTLIPLIVSTVLVALVRAGEVPRPALTEETSEPATDSGPADLRLYRGVLVASALFGFSFYSLGFPILTAASSVAAGSGGASTSPNAYAQAAGVLAYVLYLGVSALSGLATGAVKQAGVAALAGWGYFAACLGSIVLAVISGANAGVLGLYLGVIILGLALGVVETLEPTLVSKVTPAARKSRGMGALTAARSVGLFVGNLAMGLLYHLGPAYSYGYAAIVALAAAVILIGAGAGQHPAGAPARVQA
ncbi:MAG: MFS transporter [Chloroflexi bacterium]|nr:MFS transporter [Chloroflexota bacterium]